MRAILLRSILLCGLLALVTCGAAYLVGLALGGNSRGWMTLAAFGLLAEALVLLLTSYNGPLAPKASVGQFPTALDGFLLEQEFRRGPGGTALASTRTGCSQASPSPSSGSYCSPGSAAPRTWPFLFRDESARRLALCRPNR